MENKPMFEEARVGDRVWSPRFGWGTITEVQMTKFWQKLHKWFFGKKSKRLELCFVSYSKADKLLRKDEGWQIAKEEDNNRVPKMVYLERIKKEDK